MNAKVKSIIGTIELSDGSTSYFSISEDDGGYQQWGAPNKRIGESQPIVAAMTQGLLDEDLLLSVDDDEPDED